MQTIKVKNITELSKKAHGFCGYRLAIAKKGCLFTKYFSAKKYGSLEAAFAAATQMRSDILEEVKDKRRNPTVVFAKYKASGNKPKTKPSPVKDEEQPVAEEPKQIEIEAKDVDEFVYKETLTCGCVAIVDENGISFENGENVKLPSCTLNRLIELQSAFWLGYVKGNNNSKN